MNTFQISLLSPFEFDNQRKNTRFCYSFMYIFIYFLIIFCLALSCWFHCGFLMSDQLRQSYTSFHVIRIRFAFNFWVLQQQKTASKARNGNKQIHFVASSLFVACLYVSIECVAILYFDLLRYLRTTHKLNLMFENEQKLKRFYGNFQVAWIDSTKKVSPAGNFDLICLGNMQFAQWNMEKKLKNRNRWKKVIIFIDKSQTKHLWYSILLNHFAV